MEQTFLVLIAVAMTVTAIINALKPAYEGFIWKKLANSISIIISFALGIAWAFAAYPYLNLELSNLAITLIGLAIGTGSGIFYDIRSLISSYKNKWNSLPKLDK